MRTRATLLGCLAVGVTLAAGQVPAGGEAQAGGSQFEFTLEKPAVTSGGVYDAEGRLVCVLWTMRESPPGKHSGQWDGRDQLGQAAPAGEYRFRVAVNRATYRNVGAIGNSGQPPNAAGHTPSNMESVAMDAAGAIYTANGWDEAGADFKKWDPSGKSVYDAHYQIRNGQPNGAPYALTVDDQFIYCSVGGWTREPWNEQQEVQRFRLSDGQHVKFTGVRRDDGHINVYEWPSKQIAENTPPADAALMDHPLRALAVLGDSIFVADALKGRILRFHKETGEPRGEFPVKLPQALAADASGRLWVGHQHHLVSVFTAEGQLVGQVLSDVGEVEALAFGPRGRLCVADSGAGQVKVYEVTGSNVELVQTLGQKAQPGDRAPDRFFRLRGVAVDTNGDIATIQTEPVCGARLARWSPDGKLVWEQFGAEFVSLGNYGASDPSLFYSMTFHRYRLLDRARGKWDYLGSAFPGNRSYSADVHGVPRVLRLGKSDFCFFPTGDGVQVYRVDRNVLRLAALVGGRSPSSDGSQAKELGQWTWHDANGAGEPAPSEIVWFKQPGQASYNVFGMDVDQQGSIWFGNLSTRSIWQIPVGPLDRRGNPTYDWSQAREVVPRDNSPLEFQPNMVQHAQDGSLYAFGWSQAWPSPDNNPFWMGGTTLVRYDKVGQRLWAVPLPEVCVGLDAVPGGGCMVGAGRTAKIYHYSPDGLLIGTLSPGEAMGKESGWMDNHASVAVNRNPRDGILDVFAEDDYVLRLGWYRVDDRDLRTITGPLHRP